MDEAKTIRERSNDLAVALVERSLDAVANPPAYLIALGSDAVEAERAFHYDRMTRLTTRDDYFAVPVRRVA